MDASASVARRPCPPGLARPLSRFDENLRGDRNRRWESTAGRYGAVAIAMHWTTAIAVLGLFVSGFRAAGMADPAFEAELLRIHAAVGVFVLTLTVLRIAWWRLADRTPADAAGALRCPAPVRSCLPAARAPCPT